MYPDGTDAELAQHIAAAEGDTRWAEAALYRRFSRRIELYGRRHLGGAAAAQDLVQQVILRALESLRAGRLSNPHSLASFVLGICRNVASDVRRAELRAQKLELARPEELPVPQANDVEPLEEPQVVRLFGWSSA
jgi:DNA-directed RNA polymerase specialized sigma24 family protein